jgi:hypothetical protein
MFDHPIALALDAEEQRQCLDWAIVGLEMENACYKVLCALAGAGEQAACTPGPDKAG